MLGQSCTADTDERRTHEQSHTCETRLAPFDSVSAVPISAISASMSVKAFFSVSLIFGDLHVVKIDVRLQRFGLMSVLYCLLKTPFIGVFFEFKSKMSEHFSTFTQRWLPSKRHLFAVTHEVTCPKTFSVHRQKLVWNNTLPHSFYPIKLLSSCCPDQNFGGKGLFNGSRSLEHLCRSVWNYLPIDMLSLTLFRDNSPLSRVDTAGHSQITINITVGFNKCTHPC